MKTIERHCFKVECSAFFARFKGFKTKLSPISLNFVPAELGVTPSASRKEKAGRQGTAVAAWITYFQ